MSLTSSGLILNLLVVGRRWGVGGGGIDVSLCGGVMGWVSDNANPV